MFVEIHEGRRGRGCSQSLAKWITTGLAPVLHVKGEGPAIMDARIKSGHDEGADMVDQGVIYI